MSININVNGSLYPTLSSEPTHRDIYGEGGFRCVDTISDMNEIPDNFKKTGMLVYVENADAIYQYNGVSYEAYSPEIDSSQIADGSVDTDKLANYAITSIKLNASSVTAGKIASSAVVAGNIANGSVTLSSLDSTITEYFMTSFTGVPSASDAPGVEGTMAYDSDYLYVCLDGDGLTGEWARSPIASW